MKRNVLMLAAIACCAISATVFNACTNEELHPTTYRYEVQMDPFRVGYLNEISTVYSAFNQAVGADASYQTMLKSPQDNEMKAKCENVRQQYADIRSAYLKFYLIRVASAVDVPDVKDTIASYELGQALKKPYVSYSIATNEIEAYNTLEEKKGSLDEKVYNATKKTLLKLLGRHIKSSSSTGSASFTSSSVFEMHFKDEFSKVWEDSQDYDRYVAYACDSIAAAHASDTLAVPALVVISKKGLLNNQVTTLWEKTFTINAE